MLAQLVGPVDLHSAAVLVSFFFMITVIGAIWFAKRRSRQEIANDFELAKIKVENERMFSDDKQNDIHEENKFKLETERIVKMGQLRENLITSHTSQDRKQGDKK